MKIDNDSNSFNLLPHLNHLNERLGGWDGILASLGTGSAGRCHRRRHRNSLSASSLLMGSTGNKMKQIKNE